jgi:hypothetical protein
MRVGAGAGAGAGAAHTLPPRVVVGFLAGAALGAALHRALRGGGCAQRRPRGVPHCTFRPVEEARRALRKWEEALRLSVYGARRVLRDRGRPAAS